MSPSARAERTGAAAALMPRDSRRRPNWRPLAPATSVHAQAVKLYGGGAQALARQNLAVVGQSYELGRVTVFDVLAEQRRYLDVERAYTEPCVRRTRRERRSIGRSEKCDDE